MSYSDVDDWKQRHARIRLLTLDVDGVLTTGLKYYSEKGLTQLTFHARDGLGIWLLQKCGVHVSMVTNAGGDIVRARAAEPGRGGGDDRVDLGRAAACGLPRAAAGGP